MKKILLASVAVLALSAVSASAADIQRRQAMPAKAPVYVEIDPVSAVITQLLVPYVVTVGDITPSASDDGVDVELVISHAVHTLRKSRPDYDQLLEAVRPQPSPLDLDVVIGMRGPIRCASAPARAESRSMHAVSGISDAPASSAE